MLVNYRVPSNAMRPTLQLGQQVSVDSEAYSARDPDIGVVVVFHPPWDVLPADDSGGKACSQPRPGPSSDQYIKRIVAGPGDVLSLRQGRVVRDGITETRDDILPCAGWPGCESPEPIVVPPGMWYLLGDNRGQSADSRQFGPIPTEWIVGKVELGRQANDSGAAHLAGAGE